MFGTRERGSSLSSIPKISVVTYLWNGGKGYLPESVNVLYRMFRRQCPSMRRFICVMDGFERHQFDEGIEVIPTPEEALKVSHYGTPNKPHAPSCYRRLYSFSDGARDWGEWIFQTDVDCVLTDSIEPLLHNPKDFVGWRPQWINTPRKMRVGGGSFLLKTGSHRRVWQRFSRHPRWVIEQASRAGFRGSDQAVMSHMLRGCAVWPQDCGIYRIGDLARLAPAAPFTLPKGARIVHFLGPNGAKPWNHMHIPWVADNWQ